MNGKSWASDVPVSLPQAPTEDVLVPMDGFCFTASGLFHQITPAVLEALKPTFGPNYDPTNVVENNGRV